MPCVTRHCLMVDNGTGSSDRASASLSRRAADSVRVAAVALAVLCGAHGIGWACEVAGEEVRAVVRTADAQTIEVDGGGEVRLAGIIAPSVLDAGAGAGEWPAAQRAKAALEQIVAGGRLVLGATGRRIDRYGRVNAQVFVGRGDASERIWVQGELVRQGHARVVALEPGLPCVAELLQREAGARAAGAGVWADPAYVVRRAEDVVELVRLAGVFLIVEGRVVPDAGRRLVARPSAGRPDDARRDRCRLARRRARAAPSPRSTR